MDWTQIGMITWGSACTVGALILVFLKGFPNNRLWLMYLQYLVTHVIITILFLVRVFVTKQGEISNTVLLWLGHQLMLFAATVYLRIACVLVWRKRQPLHTRLTIASWAALLIFSICICVVCFIQNMKLATIAVIIMYSYYCPCSLFALISIYIVCWKVLRHRSESYSVVNPGIQNQKEHDAITNSPHDKTYEQLSESPSHEHWKRKKLNETRKVPSNISDNLGNGQEVFQSDETNLAPARSLSCGSCWTRTASKYMVLAGAIGGTIGFIDFQLPALQFLGLNIWEVNFLGRVLDVAFYLPTMIPCILWLDLPSNFQMAAPHLPRESGMTLNSDGTHDT